MFSNTEMKVPDYGAKNPLCSYSQHQLATRLTLFGNALEKKLEQELKDEMKSIDVEKLTKKEASFFPDQPIPPLQKLKILKFRDKISDIDEGYCLGLSFLLIKTLLEKNNPDDFYQICRFFINCPSNELIKYEEALSSFYFSLLFAQHSQSYSRHRKQGYLKQSDSKEILSYLSPLSLQYSDATLYHKFNRNEFLVLLKKIDMEHVMRITPLRSLSSLFRVAVHRTQNACHAMTLYADEEKNLFLYNSNNTDEFQKFTPEQFDKIYDALLTAAYTDFGYPVPKVMPLNYDLFSVKKTDKKVKEPGRGIGCCNVW